MDDKTFQEKLAELVKDINQLPASEQNAAIELANEARQRQERMKKTIGELTESLDYLRLSVKYLVFDLEATRRENAYLRSMVEKLARGTNVDSGFDTQNTKNNRGPQNRRKEAEKSPRESEESSEPGRENEDHHRDGAD